MSEPLLETERVPSSGGGHDADFLAYDFYKSFTSLCMLTLGGILTLSETVFGKQFEVWQIIVVALPVALSGLFALQCQTDMLQLAKGIKPRMELPLRHGLRIIPALYGVGIGSFLYILFSAMVASQ